jgi:hypothetical protein
MAVSKVPQKIVRFAARCVTPAAALTTVFCYAVALPDFGSSTIGILTGRYASISSGAIRIPSAATWPLEYACVLARPGLEGLRLHVPVWTLFQGMSRSLLFVLAGIALTVFANIHAWRTQDYSNRDAKTGLCIWIAASALSLFDLVRCAMLPEAWDSSALVAGLTNGEVLRAAEAAASSMLLCYVAVLAYNRVRPDLFGPFARVMNRLRRGLTWRGAAFVMLLPLFRSAVYAVLAPLGSSATTSALIVAGLEAVLLAASIRWLLTFGLGNEIRTMRSILANIIRARPLLGPSFSPPSPGRNGSTNP